MNNNNQQSILVIGAGNMGKSIVKGLLAKQWPADMISFFDPRTSRHALLKKEFPDNLIISSVSDLESPPRVILLAVKPHDMEAVCQSLHTHEVTGTALFISVAAGLPIRAYQHWLGSKATIVRCMPNTPAAVGLAMTGLYTKATTSIDDKELADQILNSIGETLWVDKESLLDAVTAVSGSGPAYLFYLMEGMQKSGQSLGLNTEESYKLVLQTIVGAADLAKHQALDFETLRKNVTSKGGTTEQAINCFKHNNLHAIIEDALSAAENRSNEISQTFKFDKE